LAIAVACAVTVALGGVVHARGVAQLRVIVPRAAVRSGAGFAYRSIYLAERGEVMPVVDRSSDYWFRVQTPDGRFGWIYGEQVLPFVVDLDAKGGPSGWQRFRDAVFAPSPIPGSIVSFTFSGGALGGDGMFMFRPGVTLDSHFAIEAHIGEAIGGDGSVLLYGVGGNVILWPLGPLVPFLSLGGGAATSFPKVNGVTQSSKTQFALDGGGGLAIIFKKRIILRADIRNYTIFTANTTQNRQEYSGGLAVFF
jgi:Bacterial SH3 domain